MLPTLSSIPERRKRLSKAVHRRRPPRRSPRAVRYGMAELSGSILRFQSSLVSLGDI
jgi:hypothetical protein